MIIKNQTKYEKKIINTDTKYRLVKNTRRKIQKALNGELKSSSTKEVLAIDIDLYRKWIEWQMTPEMNWTNIEIAHEKINCLFDVSKGEELKEAFNWKNTQLLLKKKVISKRVQNLIF